MNQVQTELSVAFGCDVHRRTVAWPVIRSTEKAWLIETPGGEIWMPAYRWRHIRSSQDELRLRQVCDLFADLSSTHRDARVSVRKAGKGTTDTYVDIWVRRLTGCRRSRRQVEGIHSSTRCSADQG